LVFSIKTCSTKLVLLVKGRKRSQFGGTAQSDTGAHSRNDATRRARTRETTHPTPNRARFRPDSPPFLACRRPARRLRRAVQRRRATAHIAYAAWAEQGSLRSHPACHVARRRASVHPHPPRRRSRALAAYQVPETRPPAPPSPVPCGCRTRLVEDSGWLKVRGDGRSGIRIGRRGGDLHRDRVHGLLRHPARPRLRTR
jgi:hypothetical protein